MDASLVIGVAIPVPAPYGPQLREFRRNCGDAQAELVPSHVTLAPPMTVPTSTIDEVSALLTKAAAEVEPFTVKLRGTDTFRPVSPVVFVALEVGDVATSLLAEKVVAALGSPELQFEFHPHVTIAYLDDDEVLDKAEAELAMFAADFEVSSFWLYEFDATRGWLPRQEFILGKGECGGKT